MIIYNQTQFQNSRLQDEQDNELKAWIDLKSNILAHVYPHSRPHSHDPSDLRQGSRALAGPNFLSMCRVLVSYSQPIRFARIADFRCWTKPELSIPAAGQKDRGSGDENGLSSVHRIGLNIGTCKQQRSSTTNTACSRFKMVTKKQGVAFRHCAYWASHILVGETEY